MTVEQLVGKYKRLQGELSQAYAEAHWNQARVDRIADEIARVERELAGRGSIRLQGPERSAGETPATA